MRQPLSNIRNSHRLRPAKALREQSAVRGKFSSRFWNALVASFTPKRKFPLDQNYAGRRKQETVPICTRQLMTKSWRIDSVVVVDKGAGCEHGGPKPVLVADSGLSDV
jgi:hypothetical protein